MTKIHSTIAIWIRVSRQSQVLKASLDRQENILREFVKAQGWEVGEVYRLEALTGKSVMKYPETRRMLHDVKIGVTQSLVFYKLDRLARNTKELIQIAEIFEQHNANLISTDMKINTSTPLGKYFFRSLSSMAEFERDLIEERIRASIKARIKEGNHLSGTAPFGYMIKDRNLIPNPDESPVVRLMFELFLQYQRKKTVADHLNQRGYRTRSGKAFTDSTVRRILKNSIAKGIHIINHTGTINGKRVTKPKEEWVFVTVPHIVNEELWDEVNAIIDNQYKRYTENRTQKQNTKVHLFTNFVYCSCGSKMRTHIQTPNYKCTAGCGNMILKEDLEALFHGELSRYVISEQDIQSYQSRVEVELNNTKEQLVKLKKDKEKLEVHIEKLLILHTEGKIPTEAFESYHEKPYTQLNQIEISIARLENIVEANMNNVNTFDAILKQAQNLYEKWGELSHIEKRNIIETITKKIVVSTNTVDITLYNILPENESFSFLESKDNGQRIHRNGQYRQLPNSLLFLPTL